MAINFNFRTQAKALTVPLSSRAALEAFVNTKIIEESSLVENDSYQPEGKSLFGTPVYGTLLIQEPKYKFFQYSKSKQAYEEKEAEFSPSNKEIGGVNFVYVEGAIIEVSQKRNIVKTSISGQNGTVKEYINDGDFDIKITGYFNTANPDVYPEQEVKALKEYLSAPVPVNITNRFLNQYFGIYTLVIESYEFKQVEGMRNVQYFTLQAVSDVPFETIENTNV